MVIVIQYLKIISKMGHRYVYYVGRSLSTFISIWYIYKWRRHGCLPFFYVHDI